MNVPRARASVFAYLQVAGSLSGTESYETVWLKAFDPRRCVLVIESSIADGVVNPDELDKSVECE